jgi:hypothetical protein
VYSFKNKILLSSLFQKKNNLRKPGTDLVDGDGLGQFDNCEGRWFNVF